jgi:hypothetical protein
MKLSLTAIGLMTCGLAMGQNVTLVTGSWQDSGIFLLPSSSPDFTRLMQSAAPTGTQDQFAAAQPYSFVLQNQTPQTVVAFSTRWTCVDAGGRIRTHDRTWSTLPKLSGLYAITSGAEQAVTPMLNPSASLKSGTFAKELAPFSGQQSITRSLEAVILGDGTALGPDANNTIPRVQARLDAERLVLTGAIQAWNQGSSGEMSNYLQALIASAPPQVGPLAIVQISSPAAAYSAALSDAKTRLAKQFLSGASNNPAAFANFAQIRLSTADLNIHR